MTFTKIALVAGLALFGLIFWLAVSGVGAAREGLISLLALVVLVVGGNLLSGRSGHYGRGSTPARPSPASPDASGLDAGRGDEPTQ